MKLTIEKFFSNIAQNKAQRDDLAAEINSLVKKEGELTSAANEAAATGDVDAYMAKKAELDRCTATLYVKRAVSNNMTAVASKEDAREAWSNYAADYDRQMKKKLADFEAEKEKFLQMYSDLVDFQKAALEIRERLAETVGENADDFGMTFIPVRSDPTKEFGLLKLVGYSCGDPDSCYYLSNYANKNKKTLVASYINGIGRDPEEARICSVVATHSSKPTF